MRAFKRDRQANSSFLYHREIYPYMYTYMSEEVRVQICLAEKVIVFSLDSWSIFPSLCKIPIFGENRSLSI